METVPATILAGGQSQRMGCDKAQLSFGAATLLDHALSRIADQTRPVAVSRHSADIAAGAPVIADRNDQHEGPLAGILAGLRHFRGMPATHMVSIAVDTPFFPVDLVSRLLAEMPAPQEIIVARSNGRAHPVFALWPFCLTDDLALFLESGERKLMAFIARHPNRFADFETDAEGDPFFNINTAPELSAARKRLAAGAS